MGKKAAMVDNDFVSGCEENVFYEEKIRQLEDNISSLRMSRRILMNLLEQLQNANKMECDQLRSENARLKQQLRHQRRAIMWQSAQYSKNEISGCALMDKYSENIKAEI